MQQGGTLLSKKVYINLPFIGCNTRTPLRVNTSFIALQKSGMK